MNLRDGRRIVVWVAFQEELAMLKLEALEGVGVLTIAVALLAAFVIQLSVPRAEVLRALEAPRVLAMHPAIDVPMK